MKDYKFCILPDEGAGERFVIALIVKETERHMKVRCSKIMKFWCIVLSNSSIVDAVLSTKRVKIKFYMRWTRSPPF